MKSELGVAPPSVGLQFWSVALPVLKCAVCPACLSVFGGLFAGARLGFLGSERAHGWIIAAALVADSFVLWAAAKHHKDRRPILLTIAGGVLAVLGHFVAEFVESIGFALLMVAALQNVYLLRQHRKVGDSCCAHEHGRLAFQTHQPSGARAHEHSRSH